MTILLAFIPFFTFIVLERIAGIEPGLLSAMAVAALMLGKDVLVRHKSPKLLETGTVILFGLLALYGAATGTAWSVPNVRLAVDAGLLLIVLISVAVGRPFTLQYARETVAPALWHQPQFIRANYVITTAWAAAFLAIVAADLAWVMIPTLPPRVVIAVTVLAVLAAIRFTGWYPEHMRAAVPRA